MAVSKLQKIVEVSFGGESAGGGMGCHLFPVQRMRHGLAQLGQQRLLRAREKGEGRAWPLKGKGRRGAFGQGRGGVGRWIGGKGGRERCEGKGSW